MSSFKGPVVIGHNVWIGDNIIILPGVSIGNGCVIGAGSVVTKSISPYSVAVGNPARIIKKRFPDYLINQLEQIEWWNWSKSKIEANRLFFETDFSQVRDLDIKQIIVNQ